ncbi:carboxymuconolactone decarboxylase family protein [Noviherbaspirillum sp. CPCC 100848]|uniref:Carboxymuconolactone decarboxylase family protein n=1 Tax=Noviherbaspirillum album TaxID=3080276 RepID=A0ABU6JJD1_9BURK|nr:carboxymuconolactone decarboxylase family protein [Noviherbaspirillum sp. CPCC 100848]MEC4723800.1 carboxymuconolactone decarboxylase family protein [Noviherbaspirillum sp. CPCC 100848]
MSKFAGLGQAGFGGVAPKLAQLTDAVLFGNIWESDGLSRRDRSLITVAALIALYRHEQLPFHLQTAIEHGVSMEELAEIITHLAFYAGWPAAASAASMMKSLDRHVP